MDVLGSNSLFSPFTSSFGGALAPGLASSNEAFPVAEEAFAMNPAAQALFAPPSGQDEVAQLQEQIAQLQQQLVQQEQSGDMEGAQMTRLQLEALQVLLGLLSGGSSGGSPQAAPSAGGAPASGGGAPAAAPAASGGAPAASGGAPSSSGGGPATFGASSAPQVDPAALGQTSPLGQRIAEAGQRNCNGSGGYCFRHVSRALSEVGIQTSGASAYMAADQLAQSDKVREVSMRPDQLTNLPAGAVVVWDRGAGHPHGHISISDGKGGEYSDVYRKQITNYGTRPRVFLPADMQQQGGRRAA